MIAIEYWVGPSARQMECAIQGMRNPMNSWDRTDSVECDICMDNPAECHKFCLGDNDADLMKRLVSAGPEHRKFMRMMPVYARITAPLYFWKEFDTYKIGTVSNSCSTMHKIMDKEFTLDDFSHEHLVSSALEELNSIVKILNNLREAYICVSKGESDWVQTLGLSPKDIWWQVIQLLPSSYNQTRNVMMNYEVLYKIYKERKGHRLDEWNEFCKWIEVLPYSLIK